MNTASEIKIPTMPAPFPKVKRDYPISERENLMRALRHEKPLWMPNFENSIAMAPPGPNQDQVSHHEADYTDWFGVPRKYSEEQDSCTPVGTVFDSIDEWKDKVSFPKLSEIDWREGSENFVRDENTALHTRMNGGIFQRLHALMGFENALMDMITYPDESREFLDALADFEIEVFRKMNDIYHYDFMLYHDDWGTARAPFLSVDLFRETLLPPTVRIFRAISEAGVIPMSHNCGLINVFVPFLVDEIGAQGLEIQPINDIKGIVSTYGNRCTVEYTRPEPYFFFDPDTTTEQLKAKAREVVDIYGAHANPGAGVMLSFIARSEEVYNIFDDEIYRYSLDRYRKLR
jgi:hypothetical protein